MAPGASGPGNTSRSELPDGSYAKAAKALQTSGLSVAERIHVAEALLREAGRLTPRPEPLVRQHAIFALCASRAEFLEFRPRYWKLVRDLHARHPVPLPESLAAAAAATFRSDCGAPELVACVDALTALFADEVLRPKLEVLGALFAAACTCRLEGRFAKAGEGLDAQVERLLVAMLIQYDDVQMRNQIAKRSFATSFNFLMYPVLRSTGVVRKAGEIALRHGLFPHVEDILNTGTYYGGLYDMLEKGNAAQNSEVLPVLVEFLMRSCKNMARDCPGKALEFPKVGEKRAIAAVYKTSNDAGGARRIDAASGSLPRDVTIPLRFLKDMCQALMANVEEGDGGHDDNALVALSRLFATAADLHAYRPSYEASVARPFKKVKTANKDRLIVRKDMLKEVTIGSMMSKLLSFISEKLQSLFSEAVVDISEAKFAKVSNLAQCGTALMRLSMESVENDLPELLEAVLTCAGKVHGSGGPCDVLALLLREMFRVHSSTRKIPELFKLLASSLNDEVVLDNLHILLAENILQESIVDCIWALPRGHAEECVLALLEPGCLRPKATSSVCFLLSLIIESVGLPSLKALLPILGKGIGAKIGTVTDVDPSLLTGLAFVHASVASTLAKNSFGESSALYKTFVASAKFDKVSLEQKKKQVGKLKAKIVQDLGYQVCELRLLVGLTHLSAVDCAGDNDKDASCKALQRVLRKFVELPAQDVLVGNSSDRPKLYSLSEQWKVLLLDKGKDWTVPLLRIAGSLSPLMDYLVLTDGLCQIPGIVEGIKRVLAMGMSDTQGCEAFWDGILETEVARLYVCDCALSILNSAEKDDRKLSVLQLFPKLASRIRSADLLVLTCERIAHDVSNSQILRGAARRGIESLRVCKDRCSHDNHNERGSKGKTRGNDEAAVEQLVLENSQVVFKTCQGLSFCSANIPGDLETSALAAVLRLLAAIKEYGDIAKVLPQIGNMFSKLAVCVCYWVWHGRRENLGTYLQLLAALARNTTNSAIEGIANLVCRKMRRLIYEIRQDAESLKVHWLQRLVRVATALAHGVCGGDFNFNWNAPPGGILRCVERSCRSAKPASGRIELVSQLGLLSVQAVTSILWQTRHSKLPVKPVKAGGYSARTTTFMDEHTRTGRTGQLWSEAEWAVATITLDGGRTKSLHESELIQTSLLELVDIASGCTPSTRLSAVQTGIVRASCTQGRRAAQGLACLRCVRAALRSPHLDAACARVISRYFEKVSGAMAVSAISDTATALTAVQDAAVRGALEHGAAALLKDLSERGRSEALMACGDGGRDVLRALMETYRMDFQYNRK